MKKVLLFISSLGLIIGCKTAKVSEPAIFSVGNTAIPAKEFLYVYNKNNFQDKKEEDSLKALKDYLDLFVNFKLKVKEAENLGMDTTTSFRTEFEGYRKQLAQPYLTDKDLTTKMIAEAYERLKTEVNASHILIAFPQEASPADTLKAWQQITDIRKRILAGEEFEQLAKKFSSDSSAKINNGNLGYFTSMQMVYPFESAAYNTPKGQLSQPVRTQFGYHIIKVNDTRPSQGSVQVAHIMLRNPQNAMPQEINKIKEKAQKIYEQLQKGAKWDEMVKQYSEDLNSKEKEGKMDWFSVGNIVPSFENTAFSLKTPGQISAPVQTPYGWHILKLIDKKPIESFEKMQANIKSRLNRDSRSQINKDIFISRLKKEYKYSENAEGVKAARLMLDSLSTKQKLPSIDSKSRSTAFFTIDGKPHTIGNYYDYLKEQKIFLSQGKLPSDYIKDYINESILKYEESQLDRKYEDYHMLVKEYREGILLFSLMDDNVWSKAVKDSTGLKAYYEKNRQQYFPKETADMIILSFADSVDGKKIADSLKLKGSIETLDLKAIEDKLNARNPIRVNARRDSVEKDADASLSSIPLKVGEYTSRINGRYTYVKVLNVFKPGAQNFEDIRGQVISDYQKYLEDEWIKELKKKYPVVMNKKELEKLGIAN